MKIITLHILVVIFIFYSGCKVTDDNKLNIDITGNWHDEAGFPAYIQTREPALKSGELKAFFQELTLPKGNYHILFEYDQQNDHSHNGVFDDNYKDFKGFRIDGSVCNLNFSADSAEKGTYKVYRAERELIIDDDKTVKLELEIHNSRVMRTWICGSLIPAGNNNYYALNPGKTREYLIIRGIPFLARKTDLRQDAPWFQKDEPSLKAERGSLQIWQKGMTFNLEGTKTKRLHFLGMIHQVDIANGSWYSHKGDHGYSHFVGDKAGEIILTFKNNEKAIIPLIFGFNLWYSRPWDMFWAYFPTTPDSWKAGYNYDSTLFSGNQGYRDLVQKTVSLVDGMRLMGSKSNNTRFIFSLDLENRPVETIEIKGDDEMYGTPLISAISVETTEPSSILVPLPGICTGSPVIKPVTIRFVKNEEYKPDLEKLKHVIYTYKEEMPKLLEPEIPEGYFGPLYDFKGTQEAVYAATYLYRNGPECGAKIADSGTRCASSIARKQTVHYTFGIGIWREEPSFSIYSNLQNWFRLYKQKFPGNFPGAGEAWSRGIGELTREAMAIGYGKYINGYTDWLDSCLFTDAFPPHWIRIAGTGTSYEGHETRKVGQITETGNRENDGHGICMWGRYLTWHWLGHPADWNEKHWKATKAAVDWIQWQLDTDTIFPGKRKDILYTESECGNYEFYASYNCLHGLKLSIIMAKELGKKEEVESWTKLYRRLQQGILDNEVDYSDFGPVWHTEPENNWHDDAQKMVHIQLASDGFTYTPLQDYAVDDSNTQEYLRIDLNSYHYLMKDKNYDCLRSYGYGQGMMTQAALLLDEMKDAENFINLMVTHCYLPRLEGWTAPEGIIMHRSGEFWVPVNGYLGQDSHLADSHKALRLMLGIDDNNPDNLRLIPRYPGPWTQMSVSDIPVLTGKKRQKIFYTYLRENKSQQFEFRLERPVSNMSLRLGPIPEGREIMHTALNGRDIEFEKQVSGDSRWVWIKNLSGRSVKVIVYYE